MYQSAMLASVESGQDWGKIDSLYGFDPLPAVFEEQEKARIIHCDKVVSVVVATEDMITNRTEELKAFLRGFVLSWLNYANNPERMNAIFSEESRLGVSQEVLNNAASIEPNRWATELSKMSFEFSQEDYDVLQQTNDFLLDREVINSPVDINSAINLDLMRDILQQENLQTVFENVSEN